MDFSKWLHDDRMLTHLIGIHIVIAVILVVSISLRKLLKNGSEQIVRFTGLHWLDGISREAVKGVRTMLFWSTVTFMIVSVASVAVYHVSGRDARTDIRSGFDEISSAHLMTFGVMFGKLVLLALGMTLAFRVIRRVRVFLEAYVHHHLPKHVHPELTPQEAAGRIVMPGASGSTERRQHLEETIRRWFMLVDRFCVALTIVGGLWIAGRVVGFTHADVAAHLVLKILTYFTVARLLTLGCRTMFHVLANLGNGHFGQGHLHRYWERVVRLFPFGERCFEAAVWIYAASACAQDLQFIALVATYGNAVVQCIGIFFGTRVLIELLHVFINEAFGMYEDAEQLDQKGQTLVPLLESSSQYVIYFGSALMMLHVFGIPTSPILAGAGVVGLAIGLGAQSLVTDLVSGFFILFENQFLVGDIVQIGDASGRVEAINIRLTQIRDEYGKLYIIPNGQIKTLVNFSKGYVNAVVDIKVPTSTNLEQVMHDMSEAGRRLRDRRREVMGETVIKGLVDLTPSEMVIRAVTKVNPGTHVAMQQEYRKILKEVFEENSRNAVRPLAA